MKTKRTFASFAVDDLAAANDFYTRILPVDVTNGGAHGPLWLRDAHGNDTLVYAKPDHVPANFTVFNLSVESIEEAVDDLIARGVALEHYEGLTNDRGIYHGDGHSVAWFTDPAGNVFSLVEEN